MPDAKKKKHFPLFIYWIALIQQNYISMCQSIESIPLIEEFPNIVKFLLLPLTSGTVSGIISQPLLSFK